ASDPSATTTAVATPRAALANSEALRLFQLVMSHLRRSFIGGRHRRTACSAAEADQAGSVPATARPTTRGIRRGLARAPDDRVLHATLVQHNQNCVQQCPIEEQRTDPAMAFPGFAFSATGT